MTMRAVSVFDVTGWDQTPYGDETDGPALSRATVKKTFRGDMEGESPPARAATSSLGLGRANSRA